MKLFSTIATALLLLLVGTVKAQEHDMIVYSEMYKMEIDTATSSGWMDVGLSWCVMMEEFEGLAAKFPSHFVKGGDTEMDMTDAKTQFTAIDDTFLSMPCRERVENCGEWHVDGTADGKYHLYLCKWEVDKNPKHIQWLSSRNLCNANL